jgi:hypothetical protein
MIFRDPGRAALAAAPRSWRYVVATLTKEKSCVAPRSIPRFERRSGGGPAGGRTEIWMSPKSCVTPFRIPRFACRSEEKLREKGRNTIREGDICPDWEDLSAKCTNVSRETLSAEGGTLADGKCAVRIERPTANPAPIDNELCCTPRASRAYSARR